MNENEVFRKAIEENLIHKEDIRARVLNSEITETKKRKDVPVMRKKILITAVTLILICIGTFSAYIAVDAYEYNQAESFLSGMGINANELRRSEAIEVYKDMKSEAFSLPTTINVLKEKAEEIGIKDLPADGKAIYEAINKYNSLTYTAKITSDQIKAIKAGTSYKDIISQLGVTKDVGSGMHVLQYAVDGDKIFYLSFADENDICAKSGEELLSTLVDDNQDDTDDNTFNATLTQRYNNSIFVSCPNYKHFDSISISITDETVIEFADGRKATIEDIKGKLKITVTGGIRESYPPQGTAAKIIILD
jgi:cell division protein FtsB